MQTFHKLHVFKFPHSAIQLDPIGLVHYLRQPKTPKLSEGST